MAGDHATDADWKHWTWASRELFRRPLSGIARAELGGYWSKALGKRSIWLQDVYIDIGLPEALVDGVARRRQGERVELSDQERRERAEIVRRFLSEEMTSLLGPGRP